MKESIDRKPRRVPMSDRQRIRKHIIRYYSVLEKNEEFDGIILADYCLEKARCKNKYRATVIQYMNQLKREGLIDYVCVSREKSRYKKC